MRFVYFASICGFLAGLLAGPIVIGQRATAADDRAAILTDTQTGAVRILIDGREIARFATDGLYVAGDITYTGALTDGPTPMGQSREAGHAP